MGYAKTFRDIINRNTGTLAGAVEAFNYVADNRFFEHMAVYKKEDGEGYINGEANFEVSTINDLCSELGYWITCYYEPGNCRHVDEFSDRTMLIRCLEVLMEYCDFNIKDEWYAYSLPRKKETEKLFRS